MLDLLFKEHERKPLSKSAIVLFCFLAAYGNSFTWRELQRKLHMSFSTISKAFKELKERGLLDHFENRSMIRKSEQKILHYVSQKTDDALKIEAVIPPLSNIYKKKEGNIYNASKIEASALKIEANEKGRCKRERFKNPSGKPSPFSTYELIAKKIV